ncbi:hypothetical protein J2T14_004734 [Paenibacillus harenae]|nr:hypothetical protein [Paenibacillus harenae]
MEEMLLPLPVSGGSLRLMIKNIDAWWDVRC